ncbi:MAG: hypothetical protein H5T70_07530, partial [Chloroflexi bacterium]|nr:hypothetical protein [Chloroflexota bacterium]
MSRKFSIPSWIPTVLVAVVIYIGVAYARAQGKISPYWYQVAQLAAVMAISSLGLNLIYGFNGQFSLGHIGFYAVGAYGSALITKDYLIKWSGNQVGALAWIIAVQIGLLVAFFVIGRMRLGAIRHRMRDGLAEALKPGEIGIVSAIVLLILAAVGLAVGAAISYGLHLLLVQALGKLVAVTPKAVMEQVILFLALLNGGTMAALLSYLVGLPLLRLGSDYFGIATLGFA